MLAAAVLAALVSAVPASAGRVPASLEPGPDPGAVERVALRALAIAAADEPPIAEVQAAAAREAALASPDPAAYAARSRLSALLPRLTAEYRLDEQSNRTVGLQGSGEVDYLRLAPGQAFVVRATWQLPELVASRTELAAAAAAVARARRTDEAVRRATALHFERRRLAVSLLLSPPEDPLSRAQAEVELARVTADLDALTGGLASGRPR